jgi:hypothetical protein
MHVGTWDAEPLRMVLQTRPDLWNRYTYRTQVVNTPFPGMDDILLRYSREERHRDKLDDPAAVYNDLDLVLYEAWHALPQAHDICFNLMRRYQGLSLGRVIIARLPMGGRILPHADNYGDYATTGGGLRFHAVVQAMPGCLFHCGDETIQAKTGDVLWFNHKQVHAAENNSADDRVHLLIDIFTE